MKQLKEATVTFRVTEQEKAQLQEIAARKDIALSKLIRNLVQEFLKEVNNNGANQYAQIFIR